MAKSINEINALNSVKKVQFEPEVKKTKRGASKRGKAASGVATRGTGAGSTPRIRKASTPATGRAAQKKAQRAAARNLFANDVRETGSGSSLRASNLAVTSPLSTLAPGASLRAVPGRAPVLLFEPNVVPQDVRSALPPQTFTPGRKVGIGALYSALAPSIGGAKAFEFCENLLQEQWDTFMQASKSWQEDMAENAKLNEEAAIRAQQRAAEEKRTRTSSQHDMQLAMEAARASLHDKHAALQSTITRRRLRSRSVPAPVRVAATVASASGTGTHTITTSVVDTLDSTPVPGLALAVAPEPVSRPAPASPQERGARQAKRLRQSADEMA